MDGLRFMQRIAVSTPHMEVVDRRSRLRSPAVGMRGSPETTAPPPLTTTPSRPSIMFPELLMNLWPGGACDDDAGVVGEEESPETPMPVPEAATTTPRKGENWVMKILQVRSLWREVEEGGTDVPPVEEEEERCFPCQLPDDGGGRLAFDRPSFSKLLRRVSLAEAQAYSKMLFLGRLAYDIPNIKPEKLLKNHGLRFMTSSLEIRDVSLETKINQTSSRQNHQEIDNKARDEERLDGEAHCYGIKPSPAYEIAASAASYLHSMTKLDPPFQSTKPPNEGKETSNIANPDVASFVATTNSVTAVVAGKEDMKQAVAKDLRSATSSPCEWFICDDDISGTRYFVIQGSETLASWQANLLFEPIQFEGLDVLVHRGIYEAAKGMYEQMLPEIRKHLRGRHAGSTTLSFTGHSLGGSLSVLINLMLLIRGEAPLSSLLPVITFGAPCIMCGGDHVLTKLGLPRSHIQAISMHRDIVPRAFSCNYPEHLARILKAINGNFRHHPCLEVQKWLYAPVGELLILQPEEEFSPPHSLLPCGAGLYLLDCKSSPELLFAARSAFLNSPHPLEILSDRSAYGSEGTVCRNHDVNSYERSMYGVIRQEMKKIRKAERSRSRRRTWWPLAGANVGSPAKHHQLKFFSSILHSCTPTYC